MRTVRTDPVIFKTRDRVRANVAREILAHSYKRSSFYVEATRLKASTRYEVKLTLKRLGGLVVPLNVDTLEKVRAVVERV